MGGCCGCFEKKDDVNEVNQNDILWLQTSNSLTTGIPSNMHFSIGGLSNMSGQEPAVVTCARKAQEKLEREKVKLEAPKAATSRAGDSDTTTNSKVVKEIGGENENTELQTLSVATITQADANKDEPMKSKADNQEPIKDKASVSQEPMKSKASVSQLSQLSNDKKDTKAVVETPNEALLPSMKTAKIQLENDGEAEKAKLLPSENSAEAQLEKEVKADIAGAVQESSKDVEEPTANERVDTNVPEALPLECVGETEKEANKFAIETEFPADAIKEANSDAIKESDVINKVQSDVSNNLQLDVKPAIATKPSQISVTFEMGEETNSDEIGHESEGEDSTTDAVNLPEQSVTTETATSSTYLVNDTLVNCGTDVIVNDIHISLDPCGVDTKNESEIFTSQDGSAASEPVVDSQVANDLTRESQVSKERQSESEMPGELHGDSSGQQRQASFIDDDDDDEISWVDMSFSQPLVPQLSEIVRVGVIARVPEDETMSVVTEANNNLVASAEDGERSDIVENSEK